MYVEQAIDASAHLPELIALACTVPMRRTASYISHPNETPPALKTLARAILQQPPTRTSVVTLLPMQQIPAHTDPPIHGKRFHLPLLVNDGCWSFSDGCWQHLLPGRVYQVDPSLVHGAVNWGPTPRLHLLVDV